MLDVETWSDRLLEKSIRPTALPCILQQALPLALALQRAQLYLSKRGEAKASAGRKQFEQEVSKAIASLKDTPRLDPNQPIYYPGELEAITREQRLQEGIPVPTALIDDLTAYFGEDRVSKHSV